LFPERVLVLDANLPRRLATEIAHRGRTARRVKYFGLQHNGDPELLSKLNELLDDWILITGDDKMPLDHSEAVKAIGATIATIDPRRPEGIAQGNWQREVSHRWVHKMHVQDPGEVRRYNHETHRIWTPRR